MQVAAIAAGDAHSVWLTVAGEVFTCGWGEAGQLGLGHTEATTLDCTY